MKRSCHVLLLAGSLVFALGACVSSGGDDGDGEGDSNASSVQCNPPCPDGKVCRAKQGTPTCVADTDGPDAGPVPSDGGGSGTTDDGGGGGTTDDGSSGSSEDSGNTTGDTASSNQDSGGGGSSCETRPNNIGEQCSEIHSCIAGWCPPARSNWEPKLEGGCKGKKNAGTPNETEFACRTKGGCKAQQRYRDLMKCIAENGCQNADAPGCCVESNCSDLNDKCGETFSCGGPG